MPIKKKTSTTAIITIPIMKPREDTSGESVGIHVVPAQCRKGQKSNSST
jgi:hypothetical protein